MKSNVPWMLLPNIQSVKRLLHAGVDHSSIEIGKFLSCILSLSSSASTLRTSVYLSVCDNCVPHY